MLARIKIDRFFFRSEQIEKQGGESSVVQRARDKLIPRTVAAAATTVREKNQRFRLSNDRQLAVEHRAAGRNPHFVHDAGSSFFCSAAPTSSRTSSSLVCEKSS